MQPLKQLTPKNEDDQASTHDEAPTQETRVGASQYSEQDSDGTFAVRFSEAMAEPEVQPRLV
jgi:hypothetical protein